MINYQAKENEIVKEKGSFFIVKGLYLRAIATLGSVLKLAVGRFILEFYSTV
ncbi:MAG: hypothetical protein AAF717_00625 [Bacteroidota bacterium]